jgi:hypothetical protein
MVSLKLFGLARSVGLTPTPNPILSSSKGIILDAQMIRELYHFPRLNDCDQTLCFEVRFARFFIRSITAGIQTDTELTPDKANVILQFAQLEALKELRSRL